MSVNPVKPRIPLNLVFSQSFIPNLSVVTKVTLKYLSNREEEKMDFNPLFIIFAHWGLNLSGTDFLSQQSYQ